MIKPISLPHNEIATTITMYHDGKTNHCELSMDTHRLQYHTNQHIILIDIEAEITEGDEFKYFESNNGLIKQIISNNLLVKTPGKYYKIISSTNKLSYIKHDDTVPYPSGEQIILPQLSPQSIQLLINYYNDHECMPESVDVGFKKYEAKSFDNKYFYSNDLDDCEAWVKRQTYPIENGINEVNKIKLNQQGEIDITIPEVEEKLYTEEEVEELILDYADYVANKLIESEENPKCEFLTATKWFNSKKK